MSTSLLQTKEQGEKVLVRSNPKVPILCEECKSNQSKYKCPGCSIQSCSLPCVKSHKERAGCTGKRNQTQFVPLSQFDDNVLLSDYNLLEDVKRVAEAAQRMRTKLGMYNSFNLPHPLKILRNAAGSRRTKLLLLPNGMSKRAKNHSRYDQRKKSISWTIEWRFHSTNIVLHDHRVSEDTSFCSILEKHLKPGPWNHQLKEFCNDQLDCLKLFIRKCPKGPKSPFKRLDMKAPIRQQLANIVILEFPVVFVFLPSHNIDFEVIEDVNPSIHKSLEKDTERDHSPKGVSFREEVIEDDSNSENPKVFDLMKQVESISSHQVLPENTTFEKAAKAPNDLLDDFVFEGDIVGNLSPFPKIEDLEDLTFDDFDDEFSDDVIADLMAHLNPDDFLDFDGDFPKKAENEIPESVFGADLFPVPEELEEGEIPE